MLMQSARVLIDEYVIWHLPGWRDCCNFYSKKPRCW